MDRLSAQESTHTLQLKYIPGQTVAVAIGMLLLMWLLAEILLRQSFIQAHLPPPSFGTTNIMFEVKSAWLRKRASLTHINCIFIGHSAVESGINTQVFEEAFQAETGKKIECFNYGVGGLMPTTISTLAENLAAKYHPELLVLGTNERGYQVIRGSDGVHDSHWLRYRQGLPDPQGWFIDQSWSYQYWLRWSAVSETIPTITWLEEHVLGLSGYVPTSGIREGIDLTHSPDPETEVQAFENSRDWQFDDQQLAALTQLRGLSQQGIQILAVEMPVHPTFGGFYPNAELEHEELRQALADYIRAQGIMYWQTDTQPTPPADGWADRNHFNEIGAAFFSNWLGHELGKAVLSGEIYDPTQ
jgi:hypothetical protein